MAKQFPLHCHSLCKIAHRYSDSLTHTWSPDPLSDPVLLQKAWNISEEIILEFNDGSSIFAVNQYKSNTGFYVDGEKYILPIVSCTGNIVTKKGYIVIDVIGDKRNVTVKLE